MKCILCGDWWASLSPAERQRFVTGFVAGLTAGFVAVITFQYLKRRGSK